VLENVLEILIYEIIAIYGFASLNQTLFIAVSAN